MIDPLADTRVKRATATTQVDAEQFIVRDKIFERQFAGALDLLLVSCFALHSIAIA
jgi:hypothetical protein